MNERVKLNGKFEPEFEVVTVCGQEVKVWKKIPYEDKIACAEEYASMMCVIDLEQEIAYEAYEIEAVERYLWLKWYTNIDVSEYELDYGKMMDEISEDWNKISRVISDDSHKTLHIMLRYKQNTIDIYNQQHSLAQKAKMSLKGILNGEDILKAVAESRFVNEEMIDLLTKARERDEQVQNVVAFPWAAKKGE